MSYVTISVKIPKKLYDMLKKYNIEPDPIIREALEKAVRLCIAKELEERVRRLGSYSREISDDEIAKLIREDREG